MITGSYLQVAQRHTLFPGLRFLSFFASFEEQPLAAYPLSRASAQLRQPLAKQRFYAEGCAGIHGSRRYSDDREHLRAPGYAEKRASDAENGVQPLLTRR